MGNAGEGAQAARRSRERRVGGPHRSIRWPTPTSIGETVYTWDIATDAITWGVNAAEVLGLEDVSALASGRAFALAAEPGSGLTRHEAVWGAKDRDKGGGVPYRARCAIRCRPNRVCIIEDTGRWFADAEGRAVFAHGVVRIIGQDEEALDRAKRASKRSFVFNVPAYERQQTLCQAHAAAAFDIIEALNARRVVFAAQPVVEAGSRDLAFPEALVRIRTGDGRSSTPAHPAGIERAGLVPLVRRPHSGTRRPTTWPHTRRTVRSTCRR